jgi:hypothetical protein
MNPKKLVVPAVLAATLLGSGCATMFKSKSTSMSLEGAEDVTVNGKPVSGDRVSLSNKSDHTIEYRTASGEEGSCRVTSKISKGWIALDILAGGVGWIIDLATENWKSLDTSDCNLTAPTTASR